MDVGFKGQFEVRVYGRRRCGCAGGDWGEWNEYDLEVILAG